MVPAILWAVFAATAMIVIVGLKPEVVVKTLPSRSRSRAAGCRPRARACATRARRLPPYSGAAKHVDPSAVVAIGEGCENHERTGRATWLELRSGPNGRICVVEPIATVLELFSSIR